MSLSRSRPPSSKAVAVSLSDLGYPSASYLEPHVSVKEDIAEK